MNWLPVRVSSSHIGVVKPGANCTLAEPPLLLRVSKKRPAAGVTASMAMAALALVESRNITPALASGLVYCREVTWARMEPLPLKELSSKWKLSEVPQMSVPPPLTV